MTDVPGQMDMFGGEVSPDAKPPPRKRKLTEEWQARAVVLRDDGWPVLGDVDERGFCCVCQSHYCPHAIPWIYDTDDDTIWGNVTTITATFRSPDGRFFGPNELDPKRFDAWVMSQFGRDDPQ